MHPSAPPLRHAQRSSSADGRSYERLALLAFFKRHGAVSPVTSEPLATTEVRPNDTLRQMQEAILGHTTASPVRRACPLTSGAHATCRRLGFFVRSFVERACSWCYSLTSAAHRRRTLSGAKSGGPHHWHHPSLTSCCSGPCVLLGRSWDRGGVPFKVAGGTRADSRGACLPRARPRPASRRSLPEHWGPMPLAQSGLAAAAPCRGRPRRVARAACSPEAARRTGISAQPCSGGHFHHASDAPPRRHGGIPGTGCN